jgi:glutamate-1-semialdehyde 2,1-aminomutase
VINRKRLKELRSIEEQRFLDSHQKSAAAFADSKKVMHEGVPMSWMAKWP